MYFPPLDVLRRNIFCNSTPINDECFNAPITMTFDRSENILGMMKSIWKKKIMS